MVVEQGWSIEAAAEAAGVSERTVREVGGALSGRGRGRAAGSLLGAAAWSPTAPTSDRSRRSRRCAGCGSPARRSPSCSAWPLSTVSGILTRIGMGKLGRLGPGARRALRARAAGRADPHRRQEARPDPGRRRQARSPAAPALHRHRSPTPPGSRRKTPAGTSCTSRSTTPPAWPTPRSSPTRRPPPRSRSCAARSRSIARHGITVERAADRQRLALPLDRSTRSPAAPWASATCAPGPYRPQTNGKAERFIRTMLGGWAYGAIYGSSRRTHRSP